MQPLIDINELSRQLGDIPVKTIRHWRYVGDGPPAILVGRRVRWRPEDVEAWLEQQSGAAS